MADPEVAVLLEGSVAVVVVAVEAEVVSRVLEQAVAKTSAATKGAAARILVRGETVFIGNFAMEQLTKNPVTEDSGTRGGETEADGR
jgi:hypothetical protein